MRFSTSALAAIISATLSAPAIGASGEPLGPVEPLFPGVAVQSALPAIGSTPEGARTAAFLAAGAEPSGLLAELSHGPYWQPPLSAPLRFVVDPHGTIVSPALSLTRYGYPLLAWERRNSSYLSDGIHLAYYDALGRVLGTRQRVDQQLPRQTHSIRTASNGYGTRHVVVWGADRGGSVDAHARWYDSNLLPLTNELRVDIGGLDAFPQLDVAMLASMASEAVLAYIGLAESAPAFHGTLYLRRMRDSGELTAPISLPAGDDGNGWVHHAESPSLAATADGGLMVLWRAVGRHADSGQRRVQLRAQKLDAALNPLAPALAITPFFDHLDAVRDPKIAASAAAGFAVTWVERATAGAQPQIRLQRFDADAVPREAAQLVSAEGTNLLLPQLAMDADGDLVVAWTATGADGSVQALRRRYRGEGAVDLHLQSTTLPVLAPGEAHVLTLAVSNQSQPPDDPQHAGSDYATGIAIQLDPDAGIAISEAAGEGWACQGSAPVECRLNAVVATLSDAPPLQLLVSAGTTPGSFALAATVAGDQDDPEAVDNAFDMVVHVLDQVPEAFAFASLDGVPRDSIVVSAATTVTGFDGPLVASVDGGELSVDGGVFSADAKQVMPGSSLRLRHQAANGFAEQRQTTVTIGGVSGRFVSTTETADTTPDTFTFPLAANVAPNTLIESAPVTITGITAPAAISVSAGSYSIDGGAYTSAAGQISAGQQVRLRHTSASGFASSVTSTLTVGGVSAEFRSETVAADTTPDSFTFASVSGVARNTLIESAPVTITGITAPAAISVSAGSYSIDGGAYTSAAGQISAGQQVRLRHTSASGFASSVTSTLTVGGVSAEFRSETVAADTTPDSFTFASVSGVARNTLIESAPVTITGITAPAAISVSAGSYSIDGGPYTSAAGQISAGQQVRLRHTSASGFASSVTSTLTVGGVAAGFTSTTEAADGTPEAFDFVDVVDARRRTTVSSNTVTVSGINTPVTVSITGGGASFSVNGGSFGTASRTIVAGDRVQLRLTTANASYTTTSTTLSIGGVADVWRVTTGRK